MFYSDSDGATESGNSNHIGSKRDNYAESIGREFLFDYLFFEKDLITVPTLNKHTQNKNI